jgi:hypothetical protein
VNERKINKFKLEVELQSIVITISLRVRKKISPIKTMYIITTKEHDCDKSNNGLLVNEKSFLDFLLINYSPKSIFSLRGWQSARICGIWKSSFFYQLSFVFGKCLKDFMHYNFSLYDNSSVSNKILIKLS